MSTHTKAPDRRLNVPIRDEDHRKLKAAAALKGQSLTDFLAEALSRIARESSVEARKQ